MRLADYVMEYIAGLGIGHVFCVTGGGAMHLNDALGNNEKVEGVFMLHEQGASIAAEAYARIRDGYGACLVTSGPGATNAITGLVGAYLDSIPVIFISGQAKRADIRMDGLRQFGIQEVDIVSMVAAYSKYAVQIQNADDVRFELEKAAHFAIEGRPGPVWLDIPLDIQATQIEPESLKGYECEYQRKPVQVDDIDKAISLLNQAKRPLLMIGNGIRLAHATDLIRELYEKLGIPVMTSWNGIDLIEEDNPLFFGRPGIVANRSANIIWQHADLVLSIGCRLNLLNTGYNFESFLENAVHIMVDIDEAELKKKSLHPDLPINADAKCFIEEFLANMDRISIRDTTDWIEHCENIERKYPKRISEQTPNEGYVSNYSLIAEVSRQMNGDDIYQFTSSGKTVDIAMKMFEVKRGQRTFLNKGLAAMGYDVPMCIGSCIGSGGRRTVCVTGDGSIAMNMQELEVIKRLGLNIKLFVSDNTGYSMIYSSQQGNFKERLTGCTVESGLTIPDMGKIAEAIGIHSVRIDREDEIETKVREVLEDTAPVVCVCKTDISQEVLPRQANYMREDGQMASRPLDDMQPLLSREEYESIRRF